MPRYRFLYRFFSLDHQLMQLGEENFYAPNDGEAKQIVRQTLEKTSYPQFPSNLIFLAEIITREVSLQ